MKAYNKKMKSNHNIKSIKQIIKKHRFYITKACEDMKEYFKD